MQHRQNLAGYRIIETNDKIGSGRESCCLLFSIHRVTQNIIKVHVYKIYLYSLKMLMRSFDGICF